MSSPCRAWAAELPRHHERLRRMAQSQLCSNAGEVRIRADVVEELLGGVFEEMLDAEAWCDRDAELAERLSNTIRPRAAAGGGMMGFAEESADAELLYGIEMEVDDDE